MVSEEKKGFYRAGTFIVVSDGEYSGYSFGPVIRVLKDFDAVKELDILKRKVIELGVNIDYLTYLNENGFVEDVDYREMHLGSLTNTHYNEITAKKAIKATPLEAVPEWTNQTVATLKSYGIRTVEDVYSRAFYFNNPYICEKLGIDGAALRKRAGEIIGEAGIQSLIS